MDAVTHEAFDTQPQSHNSCTLYHGRRHTYYRISHSTILRVTESLADLNLQGLVNIPVLRKLLLVLPVSEPSECYDQSGGIDHLCIVLRP